MRQLLHKKIAASSVHAQFNTDVMKPLRIEEIIDQEVASSLNSLSWHVFFCLFFCCFLFFVSYYCCAFIARLSWDVGMLSQVKNLSGGELQRVAITLALGKPAGTSLLAFSRSLLLSVSLSLSRGVVYVKGRGLEILRFVRMKLLGCFILLPLF